MKLRVTRAVLTCSLIPTVLMAQVVPGERVVPLDTVHAIATQAERTASVTRVDAREIRNQHAPLAYDALDMQPGLHVTRRLGFSGTGLTRLVIRGAGYTGPAGLQVLIDGRPDPTVSLAHPIPQAHVPEDISHIQVIRGPSPVLHGPGRTGVVNIRTIEPGPGLSGRAMASVGSFGTVENYLRGAYGWGDGYVRVSGSYRQTDGHRPDTDAWIASGNVRVSQQLGDSWRARLTVGQTRDRFAVSGPFFVPGPFGAPGTTHLALTHTTGDLDLSGRIGDSHLALQLWGNGLDPRSQVVRPNAERADIHEIGTRLATTFAPWAQTRVVVGADVLRAAARNTPAGPPGLTEMDVSIMEIGPHLYVDRGINRFVSASGGVRITHHSEYGTEPSGEIGLIFRPAGDSSDGFLHGTSLRTRATRGFQSPTLQQLFGVFLGGLGGQANPELRPERVDQFEAGINQALGRLEFDVVVFRQQGRDLIVLREGRLGNSGEFRHTGLETQLRGRPVDELMVQLGFTAYNLSEEVLRVPHRTLDLGLTYEPTLVRRRDLSLGLFGRYAAELYDQALAPRSPRVRLENYLVADLRLGYRFARGAQGFVALENLTDNEYETIVGNPVPGRSVFAGVSVAW
ncbi:MAG: TonB-dependent receptor [Gemmatimonadetes bacterium]|nr:TonB-dependent receptor [Gemmatimonadota bacterium]